jgi:UDP:flavonoid glycosyltransferase YjiC (YdhE family)
LILPQGADQFFNAEILSNVGAGRALLNDAQALGAIGQAALGLLGDGRERAVAAQLRDEIAGMPAPGDVVPALVALAR